MRRSLITGLMLAGLALLLAAPAARADHRGIQFGFSISSFDVLPPVASGRYLYSRPLFYDPLLDYRSRYILPPYGYPVVPYYGYYHPGYSIHFGSSPYYGFGRGLGLRYGGFGPYGFGHYGFGHHGFGHFGGGHFGGGHFGGGHFGGGHFGGGHFGGGHFGGGHHHH